MKRTTRAFATGILFATTILAIIYYTNHKQLQPNKISEKQYEQLMAERNELAHALEKLKKETKKATPPQKETYIYTLTIAKGEASQDIARRLEQARIIDNAQSFLTYLDTHHLTRALRPGTYIVTSDMSYEQIAQNITK
ncbi:aminodeoxychorismate lyase [Anoxybacillus flavithermus]|uniref:Aminodeoxychorismate lyase n=1 Tax=Anoxybacillus flavithermus TaxID=33934 RepID=A0A2G5RMB1_9BACL|nr:endolytic transglycosylase MltG [Anoxybacillus flavithermus]PIC03801.1 aminodeoxychorismate lyase [Anoxybacillus flavithermus]